MYPEAKHSRLVSESSVSCCDLLVPSSGFRQSIPIIINNNIDPTDKLRSGKRRLYIIISEMLCT